MENKDLCILECRIGQVKGISEKTKTEYEFFTFGLQVGDYVLALSLKDSNGVSKQVLEQYLISSGYLKK